MLKIELGLWATSTGSDAKLRIASRFRRLISSPSVFEVVTFSVGLILLAAFFQLRADQESHRAFGVGAFLTEHSQVVLASTGDLTSNSTISSEQPDQSLWSEKRVEAYAESNALGGEPPLAVLSIEHLGIQVPVYDGADEHNLNRGVARVRGTARVGDEGNLGIAGHRDGFFRPLKDIQHGELVELMTPQGLVSYHVVQTRVVNPDDVEVLDPTDERTITLVTCFPFYWVGDAPQRFIVTAVAQSFPKF